MPGSRDRYFNAPPSVHNVGMGYAWSPDAVATGGGNPVTGTWVPVAANAAGYLQTTASLAFTGSISASINNIAVTGGQIAISNVPTVTVGNGVVPISGTVLTVVTGAVQSSITNPIGVTGTKLDAATIYAANPAAPYNFVSMGGRVVQPSGAGSVTGSYTSGQYSIVNIAPNGGIFVNQGALESGYDSVTAKVEGGNAIPVLVTGGVSLVGASLSFDSSSIVLAEATGNAYLAYISGKLDRLGITGGQIQTIVTGAVSASFDPTPVVNAQVTGNLFLAAISGQLSSNLTSAAWVTGDVGLIGSSNATTNGPSGVSPWTSMSSFSFGQALAANSARFQFGIQNIHTGIPLYVRLSANATSTGDFTFILPPNSLPFVNDRYKGAVTASGGGWTAWEIA